MAIQCVEDMNLVVLPRALYLDDALEQLAVHLNIDLADEKVKTHLKCIRYLGGHLDGGLHLVAPDNFLGVPTFLPSSP